MERWSKPFSRGATEKKVVDDGSSATSDTSNVAPERKDVSHSSGATSSSRRPPENDSKATVEVGLVGLVELQNSSILSYRRDMDLSSDTGDLTCGVDRVIIVLTGLLGSWARNVGSVNMFVATIPPIECATIVTVSKGEFVRHEAFVFRMWEMEEMRNSDCKSMISEEKTEASESKSNTNVV
tara:strand:+ start:349 stop:894 length:546 start_codon:yes stop_codon:yes gene_type:complete